MPYHVHLSYHTQLQYHKSSRWSLASCFAQKGRSMLYGTSERRQARQLAVIPLEVSEGARSISVLIRIFNSSCHSA